MANCTSRQQNLRSVLIQLAILNPAVNRAHFNEASSTSHENNSAISTHTYFQKELISNRHYFGVNGTPYCVWLHGEFVQQKKKRFIIIIRLRRLGKCIFVQYIQSLVVCKCAKQIWTIQFVEQGSNVIYDFWAMFCIVFNKIQLPCCHSCKFVPEINEYINS